MKTKNSEKKNIFDIERCVHSVGLTNTMAFDKISGYDIRPGFYNINGATAIPGGVNFTVHSQGMTSCELLLFHRKESEPYAVIKFPEHYKIGDVYSMIVFDLDIHDFEYAYSLDGPYDVKKGLLFSKDNYLLDPYARAVTGQSEWGQKPDKGSFYKARVVVNEFDWGDFKQPNIDMSDLIIYEAHVRGFTNHSSSGVSAPGTIAGFKEKIPYLKELGINAIELMPIFEFDESRYSREYNGQTLLDYWGYNSVCFFAPNTSYASKSEYNREGTELKEFIKECKTNGIEIFLDVVFNHTAEGDETGGIFSFKGFDNNVYYMLTPDGKYYDFSGCGNTLNCNNPVVQNLILDCLRHWVIEYRIDGFRFDLASILGRNEDGSPMKKPPLLQNLAFDPILKNVKLIAEAWDAGGLYQVGTFPSWNRWAEWNGKYRDDMRSFLKGDSAMAWAAANRLAGSPDLYDPTQRPNASINFIACHDGFTLYDLYSYNRKHNEANGWNNSDGSDDNRSWNCGIEGETDNPEVIALRKKLIKNACAVLMCSRGAPMFLAGDEFCNTQFGNNNSYCQDNEISWLDWSLLEKNKDIFEFFKYMIKFRQKHQIIRRSAQASLSGFPDISYHGETPWKADYRDESRTICVMFAGREKDEAGIDEDDIVYVAMNSFWDDVDISLPKLPENLLWHLEVNTGAQNPEQCFPTKNVKMPIIKNYKFKLRARSVAIFTAEKRRKHSKAPPQEAKR